MSEIYYERPILFANADGFMEIGKIIGNNTAMAVADGMTSLLEDTQKYRRALDRWVIVME